MSNVKHDAVSHYYSGQGVVMIGRRDTNGRPKGLRPLGNVTALGIAIATSVLEHKESQTGQRLTDMRLTTEIKATLTIDLENYNQRNLALALRGDETNIPAGTVTGEATYVYFGMVSPLEYAKVSSVVLTGLTEYVNEATAWDFKVNADHGSVSFNDGLGSVGHAALNTLGVAATGVTVGATTTITGVFPLATVGSKVALGGFTGADMAVLNGKIANVLTNTGTAITIDINSVGKTITFGTGKVTSEGVTVPAAYSYAIQYRVEALTQGSQERFLRFEGLNTADENLPVIVECFRFLVDPMADRGFISDDVAKMTLTGSLLIDSEQSTGSKFFRETMLRQ